jgi:hypothetical protein
MKIYFLAEFFKTNLHINLIKIIEFSYLRNIFKTTLLSLALIMKFMSY